MLWELVLAVCVVILTLVQMYRHQFFDWAYSKCTKPVMRKQVLEMIMTLWVMAIAMTVFSFNQIMGW